MPHAHHGGHADTHHAHSPVPLRPSAPVTIPTAPGRAAVPIAVAPAAHHHAPAAHSHHAHGSFHPLPVIGHAEAFYLKHVQEAEAAGDRHARASHKVGQHVTAALDPKMPWEQKLLRFRRALEHYCVVPHDADPALQAFYAKLADLVRRHAGQEAARLARKQHEGYTKRLQAGASRDTVEEEAETFFFGMLGHGGRPDWCPQETWNQITAWRDHWV